MVACVQPGVGKPVPAAGSRDTAAAHSLQRSGHRRDSSCAGQIRSLSCQAEDKLKLVVSTGTRENSMNAAKTAAVRVTQEWIAHATAGVVTVVPQRSRVISSALGAGVARARVRVFSTAGDGEAKGSTEISPSSEEDNLLRGLSPEQVRVVLSVVLHCCEDVCFACFDVQSSECLPQQQGVR